MLCSHLYRYRRQAAYEEKMILMFEKDIPGVKTSKKNFPVNRVKENFCPSIEVENWLCYPRNVSCINLIAHFKLKTSSSTPLHSPKSDKLKWIYSVPIKKKIYRSINV